MRKVLIVSPHFPPTNAADSHRVRLLCPYFRQNGWDPHVLAVDPNADISPQDPFLVAALPNALAVTRVSALGVQWTRVPGLGSLAPRSFLSLLRAGGRLLRAKRFELIYFSTTVFELHLLGALWARRFRLPFVMDYQDPWVNDYYREHPEVSPPGGRLKYALSEMFDRMMEPYVLRRCAGITAVSSAYPEQLGRRYPWARGLPALVEPFPADERDLQALSVHESSRAVFRKGDGETHWLYAGVVIPAMYGTLRALFGALSGSAADELRTKLRLHFVGTSYSAAHNALASVEPIAAEFGLAALVDEHPTRVPYSTVLACLNEADALMVFGSDDPGYTASKVLPYLTARKPLLAILHEQSPAAELLSRVGGAVSVTFSSDTSEEEFAAEITRRWLADGQHATVPSRNEREFAEYTASSQAARLCRFFEGLLSSREREIAASSTCA